MKLYGKYSILYCALYRLQQ